MKNLPIQPTVVAFDQILTGDIHITKLNKYKYKITFGKISKILMYQVWDKDNVDNQNNKRAVFYLSAKGWVHSFIQLNEYLKENSKPLFTPTTIIEMDNDDKYACVIHKAYINSCGRVIFTISTKKIQLQNNTSNKLIQIPCGKFNNVRFDIDDKECIPDENGIINNSCHNGF